MFPERDMSAAEEAPPTELNAPTEVDDGSPGVVEDDIDPFEAMAGKSDEIDAAAEATETTEENTGEGDEGVELSDDEVMAALGDNPQPAIDPGQYQQFQQWQQEQMALQQQQQQEQYQAQQANALQQQPPPQQPVITADEYDSLFDPETGPEVLTQVLARQSQAHQQSLMQMQNQILQTVVPQMDQQFALRDYFARNPDIDSESNATLHAAALIHGKHPNTPLSEQLELMGEMLRGARETAQKIKGSKHTPRVSRTPAPNRTNPRGSAPAGMTESENAMATQAARMNAAFQDD